MAKNLDVIILFDIYGNMLTQKQQDFISYYYNDDLSLAEIAENEGITRQGVRDAIKALKLSFSLLKSIWDFISDWRKLKTALKKSVSL